LKVLEGIAPLDRQEEWDNSGLLAGDPDAEVKTVLLALDLTRAVLGEAVREGAELIVTHHPILFHARRNLREDDPEGRLLADLVRARIALIAMHTNFDNAENGVNDALCELLAVRNIEPLEGGMRVGEVEPLPLSAFRVQVETALGGPVRMYGDPDRPIRRVAVLGGAGGSHASTALESGADAFVTGEISYHAALDCVANGMCALEAGHAATERPAMQLLDRGLQSAINVVQYNVRTIESAVLPFL